MAEVLRFDLLANDRASKVFNDVGDSADKTTSRFKNFAKVGALAVAGAAVVAGKALYDMGKAAIEDETAQVKLANSLKNVAGASTRQVAATEQWIAAQGKALGVTDDELRPALSKLATATGDVGKAQKLAALAMDISAGTGKSLEQVTTALAKAQNGSAAGLTRLGIKTVESTKDTAALQAANIALTKAQDDYNKAVDTYGPKSKEASAAAAALEYRQTKLGEANAKTKNSTIDFAEAQDRLNKAYGGQASAAAETTAGKMKRLQVQFDEVKETIGAKLIPVAEKLVGWMLNSFIPACERFNRDHGPTIRRILGDIGDAFGDIGRAGKSLWENVLQPTISHILKGFRTLAGAAADMLDAMSKAPGMEWAARAADKLRNMADKAAAADRAIRGIPSYKSVTVGINFLYPRGKPTKNIEDTDDWINNLGNGRVGAGAKVQQVAIKMGELFASNFGGGVKSKTKAALSAVSALADKSMERLNDLKSRASEITSGVAEAMKGALDVGSLGGADADGNRLSVTDQLANFASQAGSFASALATAAAKGLNSNLISKVANLGPTQGLTAAQALAAMDQAQVASANASLATVDRYAQQLGQTVLTTTSLPADIAREQGMLDALLAIKADIQASRPVNITINDATDPDAVVAAIRRYIRRNGPLRGVAAN